MGLPCGEEIMIVGRTMWTQSTSVTDRRTDRITITDTVQTASHGKNANTVRSDKQNEAGSCSNRLYNYVTSTENWSFKRKLRVVVEIPVIL